MAKIQTDPGARAEALVTATNLPMVEEAAASAEVRALYAEYRLRSGASRVPGILKCFATHPPLLRHMMGLAETMLFSDGALGRYEKELIATFLSARNECRYCMDSHGAFLLQQGGSVDLLDAATRCDLASAALTSRERALLRFAGRVNDECGHVSRGEMDEMRAAGWNDLQIAETIHLAALFACFNRVISAFGVPSQELLAPGAPGSRPEEPNAGWKAGAL